MAMCHLLSLPVWTVNIYLYPATSIAKYTALFFQILNHLTTTYSNGCLDKGILSYIISIFELILIINIIWNCSISVIIWNVSRRLTTNTGARFNGLGRRIERTFTSQRPNADNNSSDPPNPHSPPAIPTPRPPPTSPPTHTLSISLYVYIHVYGLYTHGSWLLLSREPEAFLVIR